MCIGGGPLLCKTKRRKIVCFFCFFFGRIKVKMTTRVPVRGLGWLPGDERRTLGARSGSWDLGTFQRGKWKMKEQVVISVHQSTLNRVCFGSELFLFFPSVHLSIRQSIRPQQAEIRRALLFIEPVGTEPAENFLEVFLPPAPSSRAPSLPFLPHRGAHLLLILHTGASVTNQCVMLFVLCSQTPACSRTNLPGIQEDEEPRFSPSNWTAAQFIKVTNNNNNNNNSGPYFQVFSSTCVKLWRFYHHFIGNVLFLCVSRQLKDIYSLIWMRIFLLTSCDILIAGLYKCC